MMASSVEEKSTKNIMRVCGMDGSVKEKSMKDIITVCGMDEQATCFSGIGYAVTDGGRHQTVKGICR